MRSSSRVLDSSGLAIDCSGTGPQGKLSRDSQRALDELICSLAAEGTPDSRERLESLIKNALQLVERAIHAHYDQSLTLWMHCHAAASDRVEALEAQLKLVQSAVTSGNSAIGCHDQGRDRNAVEERLDACRYRFRKAFLEAGGAIVWTTHGCQFRMTGGLLVTSGKTEEQAIDKILQGGE